jgi:hypothetical protein
VFEWDQAKAASNLLKHGVGFAEAATVFVDPMALDGPDLRHSAAERRFLRVGMSSRGRILTVAYVLRSGDDETPVIRIISARRASRKERRSYEASD